MRPIKFRAFNKEDKNICDVVRIDLFVKCALVKLKNGRHKEFSFDDIELMQFTGLYDKHRKEVFEGDIVKDNYGEIGSVEWDSEKLQFFISTYDGGCFFDQETRVYEIIGNIHENPELLEQ